MSEYIKVNDHGTVLLNGHVAMRVCLRAIGAVVIELQKAGIDISKGLADKIGRRDLDDEDDEVSRSVQFFCEVFAKALTEPPADPRPEEPISPTK